jgi:hypothetical protein
VCIGVCVVRVVSVLVCLVVCCCLRLFYDCVGVCCCVCCVSLSGCVGGSCSPGESVSGFMGWTPVFASSGTVLLREATETMFPNHGRASETHCQNPNSHA